MYRILPLAALASALAAGQPTPAPTVQRYFGEPLPGLSAGEFELFERGARLFSTDMSMKQTGVANAPSCVSCHSVPTPGGSGMSERALVAIDSRHSAGSREEVVQRAGGPPGTTEARRTPALFGVGLLEATLTGIGQKPFHFGVFNRQSSLQESVSAAFATELGVSTALHCARKSTAEVYPARCRSDLLWRDLHAVTLFLRLMAPPAPPSRQDAAARRTFGAIGCSSCHVELQATGPGRGPHLSRKLIRPFSDLQVHDVATSKRGPLRTAPLWGLNSYGPPYLHDGSAGSIEAAILSHGGEAERARRSFEELDRTSRAALLQYLRSF